MKEGVRLLQNSKVLKILSRLVSSKKPKEVKKEDDEKKFILIVSTQDKEGGWGSHWYGWSRNLILPYDEAVKEKEKIKDKYDDVAIEELISSKELS